MSNGEKIVTANGVDLCVETFGDPKDPAIVLVHGASASMLWWPRELCDLLAAGGRYVVRFDNRDTGRSVSYPVGRPGYALPDMAEDVIGIMDALGIARAHLVGRSMAGGIVVVAAANHPDRVASLTLANTTTGEPGLSPMSADFIAFTSGAGPDPSDTDALVDYIVGINRVYSGPSPYFEEDQTRRLAVEDVQRTVDIPPTLVNHFVIDTGGRPDFGKLALPTLVVHGSKDPVFPLDHGEALRDAIPGAELLVLEKAGHELPHALWDVIVPALLAISAP